MDKKLLKIAIINSLAVMVYVNLVVALIRYMEKTFSQQPDPWFTPVAMLMLFVLSAAIVGSLVFVRPVMTFLDGGKKEAVTLIAYTIGCLVVLTVIAFIILICWQ